MSLLSQEREFGQRLQEEARSKAKGTGQQANMVKQELEPYREEDEESEGGGDVYALFHINSATGGANKLHTKVFLDDKERKETFKSLWKERALQKSSARLQTGESIKIAGLTVQHNEQAACLPLIVLKGKGPSGVLP